MAKLSAEICGFGIMKSLVTSYCGDHQQDKSHNGDLDHIVPLFPDIHVQDRPAEGRIYFFVFPAESNEHTYGDQDKAEYEESRKDNVKVYPEISVGFRREE
jgi:hypothetical protein